MTTRTTTWTPLKRAILEAAVKQIARSGEASLRVDRVAREAGCSPALLYRHFESREGLLEAAMVERLRRMAEPITAGLLRAVRDSRDTTEFIEMDASIARDVHGRQRANNRALTAEVLSASRARPTLRKAFVEQQREVQRGLAKLIRAGQDKGIFRSDLSADAIAEFVRAYTFGRVLVEVDPESEDRVEDWVRIVAIFLEGLRPAAHAGARAKSSPRKSGRSSRPAGRARS